MSITSEQTAADLRAAAEVLRRDGWFQGWYSNKDGCKCLVGAISTAVSGAPDPGCIDVLSDGWVRLDSAYTAVAKVVGRPMVEVWNDAPGRTADEVIAALEAAADAAEAQS